MTMPEIIKFRCGAMLFAEGDGERMAYLIQRDDYRRCSTIVVTLRSQGHVNGSLSDVAARCDQAWQMPVIDAIRLSVHGAFGVTVLENEKLLLAQMWPGLFLQVMAENVRSKADDEVAAET